MGYRGNLAERQQARLLRRTGLPLAEIAARLGVAKSSVSVWVRDVAFEPVPRVTRGRRREPNALQRRRQAEINRLLAEGRAPHRPAVGAGAPGRGGRAVRGGRFERGRKRRVHEQRSSDGHVLLFVASTLLPDR